MESQDGILTPNPYIFYGELAVLIVLLVTFMAQFMYRLMVWLAAMQQADCMVLAKKQMLSGAEIAYWCF